MGVQGSSVNEGGGPEVNGAEAPGLVPDASCPETVWLGVPVTPGTSPEGMTPVCSVPVGMTPDPETGGTLVVIEGPPEVTSGTPDGGVPEVVPEGGTSEPD